MEKKFDFADPRAFETASVRVSAFRHLDYIYVIRERKVTEPIPGDPNRKYHRPEIKTFLGDEIRPAMDCMITFFPDDELGDAFPCAFNKGTMATLLHASVRQPVEKLLVEAYWEAVERLGLDKDNETLLQERYVDLCGLFPIGGEICLFTEEENIYIEDMSMETIVRLVEELSA